MKQYGNFSVVMEAETISKNAASSKKLNNRGLIIQKVFFALFFASIFSANAQDIMLMQSGKEIKAKVTEITSSEIMYKLFGRTENPTINKVAKSKVVAIVFEDGTLMVINPITAKSPWYIRGSMGELKRTALERSKAVALEREKVAPLEHKGQEHEKTERVTTVEPERVEQNKPPTISIIDPINGSIVEGEQVKISYSVSEKTPTSVRILVDGKPVQLITDAKLGGNTAIVNIPDKDCRISIVAQSEFGASAPATVNLVRSDHIFKPSLYVLAIIFSIYQGWYQWFFLFALIVLQIIWAFCH